MKRYASLACALGLLLLPLSSRAQAQAPDPLWLKAVGQVHEARQWVAENVDMVVDVDDDKDEHQTVKVKSHLTGWDNGKPLYHSEQIEPKKVDKSKISVKAGNDVSEFGAMGDDVLKTDAPVRRLKDRVLHGKTLAVLQSHDGGFGRQIDVTVWVDPQSGELVQMETHIHVMLVVDVVVKNTYVAHAQSGPVIKQVELSVESRVPFVHAFVHLISDADGWQQRPGK